MRKAVGPRACLEYKPTHQSIRFAGRYISLVKLANEGGFDHGYLSYVFQGKRMPSIDYALRIAKCLGMGLEEWLEAIALRRAELKAAQDKQLEFARRHRPQPLA